MLRNSFYTCCFSRALTLSIGESVSIKTLWCKNTFIQDLSRLVIVLFDILFGLSVPFFWLLKRTRNWTMFLLDYRYENVIYDRETLILRDGWWKTVRWPRSFMDSHRGNMAEAQGLGERGRVWGGERGQIGAYCQLHSISSPVSKWISHLNMEKMLTLWNTLLKKKRKKKC